MKTSHLYAALLLVMPAIFSTARGADPVSFKKDIASILVNNCQACHGTKKVEGGFRVDTYEQLLKDGDSGSPGIKPGTVDDSEAFRRIVSEDKDERMPLDGDPLPAEQIALVKRWIEEGAKFDAPDPKAAIASIIPPPEHPAPPEVYPQTIPITALVFSPDGKELLVGGYHEITVWNPEDGQLLRRIKNEGQRTYALAISPDGKQLAAASGAPGRLGEVRLFDLASGELIKVLGSTADVVLDLAYSPGGDQLAMGAADSTIHIYDTASGAEKLVIASHSDWVNAVAFNADGTRLASGSRDKTAKVFDTKTGELVITYSGHGNAVRGVAFHPDGKQVYSSGGDNKIHLWNISDAKKNSEPGSFGGEVYKLVLSGDVLLATAADNKARQYDAKAGKQVREFLGHQDWVLSAAYDAASKRVATGSFDGEVRLWNAADGKELLKFAAAPGLAAAPSK